MQVADAGALVLIFFHYEIKKYMVQYKALDILLMIVKKERYI